MADLTGDGIDDLFTGCFEGGIYVLPRDSQGVFAAPQKLLDSAGDILRLGMYWDYDASEWTGVATSKFKEDLGIGATAVDWDEDGDLDLVLGSFEGHFYLRLNEGSASQPSFATESVQLAAGDEPLAVEGRDAIPKAVDWDGDGLFDLLSGSGEGGVYWLRNVGAQGAPAFARPEELVPPQGPQAAEGEEPTWPGERTQACATDYDGDGDLDLLVGDFHYAGNQMRGYVWLFRRR